ncbi:MAG: DUF1330 domain-containing protein [Bacteroidota bacterium]
MIYITQLIYLIEGQEEVFEQFEEITISTIAKHNGRLTLRIRPTEQSIIEGSMETPYEIHLVEFDSQKDFDAFKNDEERKSVLHLKEKSIKSSLLIQGTKR